jgi:hypothetical protein
MGNYQGIITHNDFDGVVSAAIISLALGINRIIFAGPNFIEQRKISITERDIVCDLPYPSECGMWFDHHQGNLMALELRGVDIARIGGKFQLEPSCARVVYNYFKVSSEQLSASSKDAPLFTPHSLPPPFFEETVQAADIIDSFNYPDINAWREETPGKIIDYSIKNPEGRPQLKNEYLRTLINYIKKIPLMEIAQVPEVWQRFQKYKEKEEGMLRLIQDGIYFLPEDKENVLAIIDLTCHSRKPTIVKNLVFLLYPRAQAVVEVQNLFSRGIKTNDLSLSMALGFALNDSGHNKDVGEIMRRLNMGDGHPGAGSGIIRCRSKKEMLARKASILKEIFHHWQNP